MSWTTARLAAAGNAAATNVTHVAWSENGSTEAHAKIARTAVTLKSATVANPSVVANNGALTSAGAASGGTASHWAFAASGVGGTADLQTTWVALTNSQVFSTGGKLTVADGELSERIHQTTSAPA